MKKFNDIPEMVVPSYSCDLGWCHLEDWLERMSDDKVGIELDLNPAFQRDYIWTKEQKVKYVEYILMNGPSGREIYFNHPNWRSGFKGLMQIVDGKQRLSAALAFLHNEIPAFGHYRDEYQGIMPMHVSFKVRVADLKTDKEIYEWYLSMNTGGTYHTEEEIEKVKRLLDGLEEG